VAVPVVEEVGVSTTVRQIKLHRTVKQRSVEASLRKNGIENMGNTFQIMSYDKLKASFT
jgi:hypothetical protein